MPFNRQECSQCKVPLSPVYLKDGVCNGCRNPHLIVTAIPALEKGTLVHVQTYSSSGKPRPEYAGVVLDTRIGVKGLGSVEYLVESVEGHQKWVAARFVTVIPADEE